MHRWLDSLRRPQSANESPVSRQSAALQVTQVWTDMMGSKRRQDSHFGSAASLTVASFSILSPIFLFLLVSWCDGKHLITLLCRTSFPAYGRDFVKLAAWRTAELSFAHLQPPLHHFPHFFRLFDTFKMDLAGQHHASGLTVAVTQLKGHGGSLFRDR